MYNTGADADKSNSPVDSQNVGPEPYHLLIIHHGYDQPKIFLLKEIARLAFVKEGDLVKNLYAS